MRLLQPRCRRAALAWRAAPWLAGLALPVFAGVCVVSLNSCSSTAPVLVPPLAIAGATYSGNRSCMDCHTNITRKFNATPHARLVPEDSPRDLNTGCEACHGPGSRHIATGGGKGRFIINPGKDAEACFRCHLETHAEFTLPYHHQVLEKRMNCVQCHDPHGADIFKKAGGLAMARASEACAACHREQTRPFVFEHESLREGCVICHNPHGSVNNKLLLQPDSNLCLRCHSQTQGPGVGGNEVYIGRIPHGQWLRQGSCWSAGCHTSIHGSNVDPRMRF